MGIGASKGIQWDKSLPDTTPDPDASCKREANIFMNDA